MAHEGDKNMIKIDGEIIEYSIRTGGEVDIKLPYNIDSPRDIQIKFEDSNDIIALLMLNSLMDINELHIYYMPYARQDRNFNDLEPIGIQVMVSLINQLNVKRVIIYDPHSSATNILLNKPWTEVTQRFLSERLWSDKVVILPDQGAYKKFLDSNAVVDHAFAVKSRVRGKPKIECIVGDVKGKDCLIVDDICDGGRTFIELAKELQKQGCGKLSLYTTYGIYCNGTKGLKKYFTDIYCYVTINYNKKDITILGDMG